MTTATTASNLFAANLRVLKNFQVGDNVVFQGFGQDVYFGFVHGFVFNCTGELILTVNVAQPHAVGAITPPEPKLMMIHPGNRVVNITRGENF